MVKARLATPILRSALPWSKLSPGVNTFSVNNVDESLQKKEKPRHSQKPVCSPLLTPQLQQDLDSVCSIHMRYDRLSWTHMMRDGSVSSWSNVPLLASLKGATTRVICNVMSEAIKEVPECNVYVVEQPLNVPIEPKYFNFKMILAQQRSSLFTLLLSRHAYSSLTKETSEVFEMKSSSVCRLFGLLIGGERVSPINCIDTLLSDASVRMPDNVYQNYAKQSSLQKALMADTLLIALGFYKLCVWTDS